MFWVVNMQGLRVPHRQRTGRTGHVLTQRRGERGCSSGGTCLQPLCHQKQPLWLTKSPKLIWPLVSCDIVYAKTIPLWHWVRMKDWPPSRRRSPLGSHQQSNPVCWYPHVCWFLTLWRGDTPGTALTAENSTVLKTDGWI